MPLRALPKTHLIDVHTGKHISCSTVSLRPSEVARVVPVNYKIQNERVPVQARPDEAYLARKYSFVVAFTEAQPQDRARVFVSQTSANAATVDSTRSEYAKRYTRCNPTTFALDARKVVWDIGVTPRTRRARPSSAFTSTVLIDIDHFQNQFDRYRYRSTCNRHAFLIFPTINRSISPIDTIILLQFQSPTPSTAIAILRSRNHHDRYSSITTHAHRRPHRSIDTRIDRHRSITSRRHA